MLHKEIEWALSKCSEVKTYEDAHRLVSERFSGMHIVHTINSLCLVVFGLKLAEGDFIKGISQAIAMGLDSDCAAASVGSILGAIWRSCLLRLTKS